MSSSPPALYRQPRLLDRQADIGKRVRPLTDYRMAKHMNGMMLTAAEFFDACKEYVIAFVESGPTEAGKPPPPLSPIVILGLRDGENLLVQPDGSWDAKYLPAFMRRYPFAYVADPSGRLNLLIDGAWEGLNDKEGELLVQPDGEPSEFLKKAMEYLDSFEQESQRTRAFCERLSALGLLVSRQLDGALPESAGGQSVSVGGFSVVDEEKLRALPDATILELHRNGILGLIQAHLLSLSNASRLMERLAPRTAAPAGAAGTKPAASGVNKLPTIPAKPGIAAAPGAKPATGVAPGAKPAIVAGSGFKPATSAVPGLKPATGAGPAPGAVPGVKPVPPKR